MNVIANNIANATTSKGADGRPYRRQNLVLSTDGDLSGVRIERIAPDTKSDFKRVYEPGNPDASPDGYVKMPNVDLPVEIMHLVAASRAYQANTAVLRRHGEITEATIELLK
jgi:flagellar basal-body rod protein FlgC